MFRYLPLVLFLATFLTGCDRGISKTAKTYASGDKATAGALIYSVVDVHILPRIGEDPTTARLPQNRFFVVKISASNSSANQVSIPGLTLVDDHGKTYTELADGANVPDWIGVLRRVEPGQTETGAVIFDAPAQHYRLRLTDEVDEDIGIDIPLTFVNETATPAVPQTDTSEHQIQVPTQKQ